MQVFALLAFAFAVVGLILIDRARRPADPYVIRLTSTWINARIETRADLLGRPLSADERRDVVDTVITEEVLIREALRRGADRGDGRIRDTILGRMYGEILSDVPEPTEVELQAWYQAHREIYRRPPSITIEQIAYPSGEDVPTLADVRRRIAAGVDPAGIAGSSVLGFSLHSVTRLRLRQLLGPDFAMATFDLEPGEWHGPVSSTLGRHFVLVVTRHESVVQRLDEVASYVRQEWMWDRLQSLLEPELPEIRSRYQIVLGWEGPGQ